MEPASGQLAGPSLALQAPPGLAQPGGRSLAAEGLTWSHVVKTTVFLADMNDFNEFNQIYAQFLAGCPQLPARSCVQVAALPRGGCVEIEAVAYRQE